MPFSSFSYLFSKPVFPIKLVDEYSGFFSNSSFVIDWIYPVKCAAASPRGYILPLVEEIITPFICNNFSFKSFSSIDTFFIGTKLSSLTHDAFNLFSIVSEDKFNNSAILFILSVLFSPSFPGTIPTEDILPFVASSFPFLSSILPLIAFDVETLTLSVTFRFGKIIFEDQSIFNLLSFLMIFDLFSNDIFCPDTFILVIYVIAYFFEDSFSIFFISIFKFDISIPS